MNGNAAHFILRPYVPKNDHCAMSAPRRIVIKSLFGGFALLCPISISDLNYPLGNVKGSRRHSKIKLERVYLNTKSGLSAS